MPKPCHFVQKLPFFVGQFPQMLYLCSGFQVVLFSNKDAKLENETQNYYLNMKKRILSALIALIPSATLLAGGLTTNTNQNAAYLRQMSQEAIIDITGLYMNPAGTAFLTPGYHFSFNIQNAKQDRDIETTFLLMQYNRFNSNPTREFHGEANAPVIPSFQFSYNWEKWSINANFAIGGGGGKAEFDSGLGTFESMYAAKIYSEVITSLTKAIAPALIGQGMDQATAMTQAQAMAQKAYQGYSVNSYLKGRQYHFCFTVGATYKPMEDLALFLGARAVYASNNYNGWVEDIHAYYNNPMTQQPVDQQIAGSELSLNADQTGIGFTPVLGIDWRINEHWNVAAKYEFKTRLRVENKSEMNEFTSQTAASNATLGQFADGTKIASDVPSLLTAGVEYRPIDAVRLRAGYHWYGDKQATVYGNKQDLIDDDTWEITAGAEWEINKWVTVSGGYCRTQYGLSDAYMNDLSFVTSSNNMGFGARVRLTSKLNLDLGYMKTFYEDRTVETQNYLAPGLTKTDTYSRTNRVFGIGINFEF